MAGADLENLRGFLAGGRVGGLVPADGALLGGSGGRGLLHFASLVTPL